VQELQVGFMVLQGVNAINMVNLFFQGDSVKPCAQECTFGLGSMLQANLRNGSWHHVVIVSDPKTNTQIYYVNGTEMGRVVTPPNQSLLPVRPGGEFFLGWGLGVCDVGVCQSSDQFTGSIDEFRIFNRSLAAEEVQALVWARALPPNISDSLVVHWGFNEPEGQVERDLSGNGNHGARGLVGGLYTSVFPTLHVDRPLSDSEYTPLIPPGFITSTAPSRGDQSWLLAMPSVPVEVLFEQDLNSPLLRLEIIVEVGELRLGKNSDGPALSAGSEITNSSGLYYHPPAAWPPGISFPLSCTLVRQSGARHVVSIYPAAPCVPVDQEIEVDLGSTHELIFRGVCADGRRPAVEILHPPAHGKLYQVVDLPLYMNKRYEDFRLAKMRGLLGLEITEFPALVTHRQGEWSSVPPFLMP
jgi:hypothetical protein